MKLGGPASSFDTDRFLQLPASTLSAGLYPFFWMGLGVWGIGGWWFFFLGGGGWELFIDQGWGQFHEVLPFAHFQIMTALRRLMNLTFTQPTAVS